MKINSHHHLSLLPHQKNLSPIIGNKARVSAFASSFYLEFDSFTMLYSFLLYNYMNQLYVYIYPLPPQPPSHPTPTFISFNTELGVLASAIRQDKEINGIHIGKEVNIHKWQLKCISFIKACPDAFSLKLSLLSLSFYFNDNVSHSVVSDS